MAAKKKKIDKESKVTKPALVKSSKPAENIFNKIKSKKQNTILVALVVVVLLYLLRSMFLVAFVNFTPVTRYEFSRELEKRVGKDTLESLVTKKLILQEAKTSGVSVSEEEINEEIKKISSLIEEQGLTLDQALASQGQTMTDLEGSIRIQKTIEKLLSNKVSVTDEEIKDYFDKNSTFYGEDANFEELKDTIEDQIKQEKISSEYSTWIENLKAKSKIIYFVDFEKTP